MYGEGRRRHASERNGRKGSASACLAEYDRWIYPGGRAVKKLCRGGLPLVLPPIAAAGAYVFAARKETFE